MLHTIGKVQYDTEGHNSGWDDKTYRLIVEQPSTRHSHPPQILHRLSQIRRRSML